MDKINITKEFLTELTEKLSATEEDKRIDDIIEIKGKKLYRGYAEQVRNNFKGNSSERKYKRVVF